MRTEPAFAVVTRGYERSQVDAFIQRLHASPRSVVTIPDFTIVLRGYNRDQVNEYIRSFTPRATLAYPEFAIVPQGYEKAAVDRFVADAMARIEALERALDDARWHRLGTTD